MALSIQPQPAMFALEPVVLLWLAEFNYLQRPACSVFSGPVFDAAYFVKCEIAADFDFCADDGVQRRFIGPREDVVLQPFERGCIRQFGKDHNTLQHEGIHRWCRFLDSPLP
jgi:hypothetical protein